MASKDDTSRWVGGPGCTQGALGCIHDVPKLSSRPRVCGGVPTMYQGYTGSRVEWTGGQTWDFGVPLLTAP